MKRKEKSNRKAVAPIIATLLMVAIAVVGGILIFVFTQGFFADEQVVGPTVDNLKITGYDARDLTDVLGHDATTIDCNADGAATNTLASGDCVAVFVTNLGDKPVAIQSVRIFGETMTLETASLAGTDDCATTTGAFNIMGSSASQVSIIEPNTDATLCFKYDGSAGDVKAGRTIPIQVETTNGQSAQVNIINGAERGQASCTVKGCPGF